MRTTLTLDDDLANALKKRARLLDQPFRQVVNDLLRRGLSPAAREADAEAEEDAPADGERRRVEVVPIASGIRPEYQGISPSDLFDQLETEDFLRETAEYLAKDDESLRKQAP